LSLRRGEEKKGLILFASCEKKGFCDFVGWRLKREPRGRFLKGDDPGRWRKKEAAVRTGGGGCVIVRKKEEGKKPAPTAWLDASEKKERALQPREGKR